MDRKVIYISGPLTSSGDPLANMMRAIEVGRQLVVAGFSIIVPHYTFLCDPEAIIPHAIWMEVDIPLVKKCDAVLRLPGESRGADEEVRCALEQEIPVFFDMEVLCDHFTEALT